MVHDTDGTSELGLAANLQTAARRYCIGRNQFWWDVYAKQADRKIGEDNSPEAYAAFPRYNVLNAILEDVETITTADYHSIQELKDLLVISGVSAQAMLTNPPPNAIASDAMDEERRMFFEFIQGITREQLRIVEPLFYRRRLREIEADPIKSAFVQRWGANGKCCYPLTKEPAEKVRAFNVAVFEEHVGYEGLRSMLLDHGIQRLWELREFGPCFEIEVEHMDPTYTGAEGYWSSGSFDWMIYASHEDSLTFGGWVLTSIKDEWPAWREHLFSSPWD